eukprot:1354150-Amorphochlora_amoeboformis.AAC.1
MAQEPKFFQIQVPNGVSAGQQLQVRAPNGVKLVFSVPPGCPPGTRLRVPMPAAPGRTSKRTGNSETRAKRRTKAGNPGPCAHAFKGTGTLSIQCVWCHWFALRVYGIQSEVVDYTVLALSELKSRLMSRKEELKAD